ncbi:MAG TPA: dihydrolipoamide acetyltransferase family protein [Actinomycetota bacterium]|nr:dihydrolipoamide acetyltransferase family protein [Actinomycetota bacterium]
MPERVFAMPDLGEGLEEGEIVSWLVAEGDEVELNQPIVEVETAKATVEIPSPIAGVIATLHAGAGDAVAVGARLVTFQVHGDASDEGAIESGPPKPAAATPAVRRLAKDHGIDLTTVTGTGPDGRVTVEDVQQAAAGEGSAGGVVATEDASEDDADRIPVTPTRRTIARRMEQAAAIPQVTTFRTVDATALETVRGDLGVSPLPVFVAALCRTIGSHPILNATWADDAIVVHATVDAGIAIDSERGLFMSVIRDAGPRGVSELSTEIRRLAEAARAGSLSPGEATGATISVSNTGSYGSEAGTPLLNPPNAVTIALGVIEPRALITGGGAVEARPACTISLTFDHRVLDGAAAGRALTDLVDLLEDADALRELPR